MFPLGGATQIHLHTNNGCIDDIDDMNNNNITMQIKKNICRKCRCYLPSCKSREREVSATSSMLCILKRVRLYLCRQW